MRIHSLIKPSLLTILALAAAVTAATAQDTATMQIRFGKEKELRTVVISFHGDAAPETVANFQKLARKGFYKGIAFHRAFPGFMVQAGDPASKHKDRDAVGTGGPGFTLPAEINRKHKKGSVAMARLPDSINPSRRSNGSQFYIALKPMPDLDGKYTVFGEVVEGLDVIEQISNSPTDSNDYPIQRITIRSIKLAPRAQTTAAAGS